MPMSPLPNFSVPVLAAALLVAIVVVSPSSPQAARKTARAVEPPVTASSLRRETGSLATRERALSLSAMLPPRSRVINPLYGEATEVDQRWRRVLGGRAGANTLQSTRNTRDALADPLRWHAGEGEAQAVGTAVDH